MVAGKPPPVDPRRSGGYAPNMPLDYLISAFVTLLLVVDPVGLAPTFLAVTHGVPASSRKQIAWRASLIAGAILMGTALVGDWLLRQLA